MSPATPQLSTVFTLRRRLIFAAALGLGGLCGSPVLADTDTTAIHRVGGFLPDLRFSLMGAGDTTVTQKDVAGKVVVMFFGYANCPDICPTTMAQLALVRRKLGDDADQVRILFVSVDPHRDRPDILQNYVNVFDPTAIGLTGTERQVAAVARRYRVAYQIEKPTGDDQNRYEVTHARGIYIFDQHGKARLLASDGSSVNELADSLRELIHS